MDHLCTKVVDCLSCLVSSRTPRLIQCCSLLCKVNTQFMTVAASQPAHQLFSSHMVIFDSPVVVFVFVLLYFCCCIAVFCIWTDFVPNDEVRSRTGQPFLSDTIRRRRLSFFGHLSRADISQDHYRALQVCILGPPKDWRHRVDRPDKPG